MQQADAAAQEIAQTARAEPNLEMLQAALTSLQLQIQFADTKAGFLATLNLLLFSVIAQEADKVMSVPVADHNALHHLTICLLVAYAITAFGAVGFVVMAVIPRVRGGIAPPSRSHFAHVFSVYGCDYQRYTTDVLNMTAADWGKELAWQILGVSHIAHTKHRLVRRSTIWTAISMALWIVCLMAIIGRTI